MKVCAVLSAHILVLFAIVSSDPIIVGDNLVDLCYFPRNSQGARVRPTRPLTRCESTDNVIVERRENYDGIGYWCIVVKNDDSKYHTLAMEFNGTRETRRTDNYFASLYNLPANSLAEKFSLLSGEVVIVVTAPPGSFLQPLQSLTLNGLEQCDQSRSPYDEPILESQKNTNKQRFLNHCFDVRPRGNRPPTRCEKLREVSIQEYRFNDVTPFYCISVDKNQRIPIYKNDTERLDITIEPTNNFVLSWAPRSNELTKMGDNNYKFSFLRDTIKIAVYPRDHRKDLSELVSLTINGVESCDPLPQKVTTCGVQKIKSKPLVTFGSAAYHGQFPWHVALFELNGPLSRSYKCGGTIINEKTILTAAHCVSTDNGVSSAEALRIEVGKFDLTISDDNTKEYRVIEVIVHERFEREYFDNDIALLKMKTLIVYTNFVQPICVTDNRRLFQEEIGTVPGWGRNELDQNVVVLSEASMPIINNNECRQSNRPFFQKFLNDGNYCAGYRNGTSVCTGDSGGGMVFQISGTWYIRGIVSLAPAMDSKCDITQLVLFTDVTRHISWITQKMNKR